MTVKPIPEGFHSVTPGPAVAGGVEALDFYERAFGAEVLRKLVMGGKLMHSELRIGDSIFSVNDPFPEFGIGRAEADEPVPVALLIYTEDVDALYDRALERRGDRGQPPVRPVPRRPRRLAADPYGHRWMIATHTEDMSEEEMQRRTEEAMASK